MTTFLRLLAKSDANPDSPRTAATLPGHTALVLGAAERVLAASARSSLAAIGPVLADEDRLRRIVLLGAFLHDLGKCSSHFQEMVRRMRETRQLVRHEFASTWLFRPGTALAGWACAAVDDAHDYRLALLAAAGHHRKFPVAAVASGDDGAGTSVDLLVAHPDFAETLRNGGRRVGLAEPPSITADVRLNATRKSGPEHELAALEELLASQIRAQDRDLLAVAKALVIAADVAGSAIPMSGESLAWIDRSLAVETSAEELRRVAQVRLDGKSPRHFQISVAQSDAPVTLVRAGCGTGKTVAAYFWAAERYPGRRLWMTYPTTGTATEGFRDYVQDADLDARLVHSRSQVDLDLLSNGEPGHFEEDADRLSALRVWAADVVVCTADTVLGLLQNHRRGVFAWPVLARSVVVFDEVHAYDDAMFGTLLRFLKALPGIPALLMTASLPEPRLRALREAVAARKAGRLGEVAGPADLESLPRYRIRCAETEPWKEIAQCLRAGGKVLWVCNTVDRCVTRFRTAIERGCPVLVYHSRYRYQDRVRRHKDVIGAFRASGAALAVTTQVAEMSLDLSADLMVTDVAPIPALIQRMGRLNRRSTPETPEPPALCVVVPFQGQPYDDHELTTASAWLDQLGQEPVSQQDLVEAWQPDVAVLPTPGRSAWLDGGFQTEVGGLREDSPGLPVILEADAPEVRARRIRAEAVVVPMSPPPRGVRWESWPRCDFWPVAPKEVIDYDVLHGGRWRRG